MKRQIIKIDIEKCTGCGECVPNCPEGALQIIDGKARLISDLFCDGLGACIGECPLNAISTEVREAEPYNEKIVMGNIVKHGENTIKAHLEHLKHHNETELLQQAVEYLKENNIDNPLEGAVKIASGCACGSDSGHNHTESKIGGCPGAKMMDLGTSNTVETVIKSELLDEQAIRPNYVRNWPIQLNLAPVQASYYNNVDLLIASDCVPATFANFNGKFVKDKTLLIGCPKLDNGQLYIEKLTEIFKLNNIKSVHILVMEVPCCSGMNYIIENAIEASGKKDSIPIVNNIISIAGKIL
ncbi:MAG: 4Fe-4S dicluster domain-containing protein [archaeon]|nr:4Fe-4S dicluster domain-containing protein [archaeon]